MAYPNGTIMITIKASKKPFRWNSKDDWIGLVAICGSIHQIIRDSTCLSEPLIHSSETDWTVTQIDTSYDIFHSNVDKSDTISLTTFNGYLKVKHLDTAHQMYSKQLPYKERCIRLEE